MHKENIKIEVIGNGGATPLYEDWVSGHSLNDVLKIIAPSCNIDSKAFLKDDRVYGFRHYMPINKTIVQTDHATAQRLVNEGNYCAVYLQKERYMGYLLLS
ncbi:MAG: hypothetical protein ACRBFS_19575 [Aureispira sp.]